MILNALDLLLSDSVTYQVVDRALNILSIKEKLHKLRPDILILDLNFQKQNVLDHLIDLKKISPSSKILILSSYDAPSLVKEAFAKGADGFLLKDTSKEELIGALDDLGQNKKVIGQSIQQDFDVSSFIDHRFEDHAALSSREQEVISLLVEGKSEVEIAETLFISKHTVHDHKKSIFKKLRIRSHIELIKYFYNQ